MIAIHRSATDTEMFSFGTVRHLSGITEFTEHARLSVDAIAELFGEESILTLQVLDPGEFCIASELSIVDNSDIGIDIPKHKYITLREKVGAFILAENKVHDLSR